MKLARVLWLVAVLGFAGNIGAKSNLSEQGVVLKPGTSLCIPCTGYCKTHPNSPRCN